MFKPVQRWVGLLRCFSVFQMSHDSIFPFWSSGAIQIPLHLGPTRDCFFRQRDRPCSFDTNKQTRQKGTCKLVVDAGCFLKLLSVPTFGKIISSQYAISKTWKPSIVNFELTFTSQKTTTMTFAVNTPPPLSTQKNHHPNFAGHASLQHSRDVALTLWFCSDWMPWRPETNGFPVGPSEPQYPKLPEGMTFAFKHPKSP